MSVNWILYLSRPTTTPWPATVLDIARACERANPAAGLTGALLFSNELYLQYLEGTGPALEALWARLARDDRHEIVWRATGIGTGRRLGSLVMGYLDADREGAPLRDHPLWRARADWTPDQAEPLIALMVDLARDKYPSSLGG
ncbi:MAG: BLUF domain-containing protein [Rhodobacteraceae bacterium]|nr:BLUF domain-containing protein [Paracoccaceae bacterium]